MDLFFTYFNLHLSFQLVGQISCSLFTLARIVNQIFYKDRTHYLSFHSRVLGEAGQSNLINLGSEWLMSLKVIEIVRKWGEKGPPCAGVSHDTQQRPLSHRVWKTIRKKPRNYPRCFKDHQEVDGMSLKRIDDIITQLEKETVQFQPVKRVKIYKKNGKLRPLGLPSWNDKLRKVSCGWC